jgi:hypothetical protein
MGHNTPTNVLAQTGEQIKEANSASAIDRFFTRRFRWFACKELGRQETHTVNRAPLHFAIGV